MTTVFDISMSLDGSVTAAGVRARGTPGGKRTTRKSKPIRKVPKWER